MYITVFKRNRTKFAGKYDKSKQTLTYSHVNDTRRNLFKKRMRLESELGRAAVNSLLGQFSGGLTLVDGVDGDCNIAVMDVDVPLHRYAFTRVHEQRIRRRDYKAKMNRTITLMAA